MINKRLELFEEEKIKKANITLSKGSNISF